MRRTNAVGKHPAEQVIAGTLHQYLMPDGKTVLYKANDPNDTVWDGIQILPRVGQWCFMKDYTFLYPADVALASFWGQGKDEYGATIPALAEEQAGGLTFQTGSNSSESYNMIWEKYGPYSFQPGKTTWFEAEVKIVNVVLDPEEIDVTLLEIGFGVSSTMQYDLLHGLNPVFPKDGFVISLASLITYNDGVQTRFYPDDFDQMPWFRDNFDLDKQEDFHKYGMRVQPNEADNSLFDVLLFEDDVFAGSYSGVNIGDKVSGVMFGSPSHNDVITIRKVEVIQEKDY